jgi:hypothetical protein
MSDPHVNSSMIFPRVGFLPLIYLRFCSVYGANTHLPKAELE